MAEEQDLNNSPKDSQDEDCPREEPSLETQDADPALEQPDEQEVQNPLQQQDHDEWGHNQGHMLQAAGNLHEQQVLNRSVPPVAVANKQHHQPALRRGILQHGTKAIAVCSNKPLTSKYRGVCWNKKNKRWQAAINSSGKYLYLGSYETEEAAARMFDKAAIRIRGHKARINFKFTDYLDDQGVFVPDPDIESMLVEADAARKGSRRGRQRGRQDEDEDESEPSSSPEHTSKQAKPEAPSLLLGRGKQAKQLKANSTADKSLPKSSQPASVPAKQQYIARPVQNVTVQKKPVGGTSGIPQPLTHTSKQASGYTAVAASAAQEVVQQQKTTVTRVIVPQLQQPVMIKTTQGSLQLPQQFVLQTDSGKVITALPLPAGVADVNQRAIQQHDALDRKRTAQVLQLQHAAAVQAARNQQQQLQQIQKLQEQQQQQPQLILQHGQQQSASVRVHGQHQQQAYQLHQVYTQPQDGAASTSGTQATTVLANSAAQGPATLNIIFQAISQQLPEGSVLDCVIPCAAEHTLGVLYTLSGSTRVGAGLWNGRNLRSLGSYGSDKDAKQACQSALQLIKDMEPSLLPKQEVKRVDNSGRQDAAPPPRIAGTSAQPLQVQMIPAGSRVLAANPLSILQSHTQVQEQAARQQPFQILLPSGVQLMPVAMDSVVAGVAHQFDARIFTDGQNSYRLEQPANQNRNGKVAEANEGSRGSHEDQPAAKRQRTEEGEEAGATKYAVQQLQGIGVQDMLQLILHTHSRSNA